MSSVLYRCCLPRYLLEIRWILLSDCLNIKKCRLMLVNNLLNIVVCYVNVGWWCLFATHWILSSGMFKFVWGLLTTHWILSSNCQNAGCCLLTNNWILSSAVPECCLILLTCQMLFALSKWHLIFFTIAMKIVLCYV